MYSWIIIVGGLFAFFAAMGIGANDVANAFATSVGSKSLTMKQAVVLAVIFETAGSILMGSHVTNTIRRGIADYQCFEEQPALLMYGCMWVVLSVGLWLFLASYLEMPVSTTHSCVGGMVGMTIALKGVDCVIWYKPLSTFPYVGGVSGIVFSWFLSPVFSAIIAMILFQLLKVFVLRHDFNSKRINWTYPILIGSTVFINCFFIIYKGAKGLGLDKTPLSVAFSVSSSIAAFSSIISVPFVPKIKKFVKNKFNNENNTNYEVDNINIEMTEKSKTYNITNEKELNRIISLHEDAEKFDEKTEYTFRYLQIFTAICDSFSHGANDVANAIGPFAAMWAIHNSTDLSKKNDMDSDAYWILGLGGIGIALGLFLYGYKITHAIGTKLCKITPSRGVAIELASALVIITGSRLKMPLSTTHCQIGATIGIGGLEDPKKCRGINCKIFLKTALGWIITCLIVGLTAGLLTAQGVYAPAVWNYCPTNQTI
jgi:solute carrier family 20 (sodium-dependent phosphate transporter)